MALFQELVLSGFGRVVDKIDINNGVGGDVACGFLVVVDVGIDAVYGYLV